MKAMFAIAIDNKQNTIIIEDLVKLVAMVYAYDSNGCLECEVPDIWNISSSEDDEHPWANPMDETEIEFYLSEIDFNRNTSFSNFSSYLRGEAEV